jgi:hypothetical protein
MFSLRDACHPSAQITNTLIEYGCLCKIMYRSLSQTAPNGLQINILQFSLPEYCGTHVATPLISQ